MIDFLAANAGFIGLLFFFAFFCVVLALVFRPGFKRKCEQFSQIPFQEDDR